MGATHESLTSPQLWEYVAHIERTRVEPERSFDLSHLSVHALETEPPALEDQTWGQPQAVRGYDEKDQTDGEPKAGATPPPKRGHRRSNSWHGSGSIEWRSELCASPPTATWVDAMSAAIGAAIAEAAIHEALAREDSRTEGLVDSPVADATVLARITELTEPATATPTASRASSRRPSKDDEQLVLSGGAEHDVFDEVDARACVDPDRANTCDMDAEAPCSQGDSVALLLRGEFVKRGQRFPYTWKRRSFEVTCGHEAVPPRLCYYEGAVCKGSLYIGSVAERTSCFSRVAQIVFAAPDGGRVLFAYAQVWRRFLCLAHRAHIPKLNQEHIRPQTHCFVPVHRSQRMSAIDGFGASRKNCEGPDLREPERKRSDVTDLGCV